MFLRAQRPEAQNLDILLQPYNLLSQRSGHSARTSMISTLGVEAYDSCYEGRIMQIKQAEATAPKMGETCIGIRAVI